jgi:DNA-binding NarL/FixJ family response regulator
MASTTRSINIVIADDHPLFRKGLHDVIEAEEHLTIVGEAGDGISALQLIMSNKPHIAVLDIDMPEMNGLDLSEQIFKDEIDTGVIILTMYDDEALFNRAMDLGVTGYVLKDSAADDIVLGIETVANGGYFLSPTLASYAMKKSNAFKNKQGDRLGLMQLTSSERKILHMISLELTSADIGKSLHISPRTVEHHRSNIIGKLKLSGQYALVRFALQNKEEL